MLIKSQESTIRRHYKIHKNDYVRFQKEIFNFVKEFFDDQEIKKQIDIMGIKSRNDINPEDKIKSIKSILDNLKVGEYKRREYNKLVDIKDIAGVRITCNCKTDSNAIVDRLGTKLRDKDKYRVETQNPKPGPYRAVHFIISKSLGKEKIYCEIQLRTVLENAWAELEHKYFYKYKQNFPKGKKTDMRTITSSLSGILGACEDLWELVKIKSKK